MWKDLMLNQFHDVLPGTSIAMAIQDALDIYARRISQARELFEKTIKALGSGPVKKAVFDPYRLPRKKMLNQNDAFEILATDETGLTTSVSQAPLASVYAREQGGNYELSNGLLTLIISHGRITSLKDLEAGRELITPGPDTMTGGLMIYDDFPLAYDAWDAEIFHLDCGRELLFDEVKVESNDLRSALFATCTFGSSRATLKVGDQPCSCCFIPDISSHWTLELIRMLYLA